MNSFITWIFRILISVDQFFNVLLAPVWPLVFWGSKGWGAPDETISSVLGKNYKPCRACRFMCRIISRFDFASSKHCRDNIEKDEGIKQK